MDINIKFSPSESLTGTLVFRSKIEDGTATGTRFRRSGLTIESVAENADFTFCRNRIINFHVRLLVFWCASSIPGTPFTSLIHNQLMCELLLSLSLSFSIIKVSLIHSLISWNGHTRFIQEMYPLKLVRLSSEFKQVMVAIYSEATLSKSVAYSEISVALDLRQQDLRQHLVNVPFTLASLANMAPCVGRIISSSSDPEDQISIPSSASFATRRFTPLMLRLRKFSSFVT
ncbi:hypothetical protein LXL04_021060 [Taraxacum kok-saghyz]